MYWVARPLTQPTSYSLVGWVEERNPTYLQSVFDSLLLSTIIFMITVPFQALSDPLRLQIIELLKNRELCVCDLCEELNVSQSKLSFHLKILKEANLLSNRQQGRWVYYQINSEGFQVLAQYLDQYSHYQIQPAHLCED